MAAHLNTRRPSSSAATNLDQVVLPILASEVRDLTTLRTTVDTLARCIRGAVFDGKSVTSGNKKLIARAAEEIQRAVGTFSVLPTTTTTASAGAVSQTPAAQEKPALHRRTRTSSLSTALPHLHLSSSEPSPPTAPKPKFAVVVESTDPRHTGDDVLKEVKSTVDVVSHGIGICSMRKTRNRRLAITCDTPSEREKLINIIKEKSDKLTVNTPIHRNPAVRLVGLASGMEDDRILEAIIQQNSTLVQHVAGEDGGLSRVVRRKKGKVAGTEDVIVEVAPALWKAIVYQRVKIGYQMIIAKDQTPLYQCFKCSGFGHKAENCVDEERCGYCGDLHDTRLCHKKQETPKCINCTRKGNTDPKHPAYSVNCPVWKRWDAVARQSINYNHN